MSLAQRSLGDGEVQRAIADQGTGLGQFGDRCERVES